MLAGTCSGCRDGCCLSARCASHRSGLALALALQPGRAQVAPEGAEADNPFRRPQDQRPAGLVLLREWQTMNGTHAIGVYDPKPDPRDASARTIVVWLEEPTGVKLAVETLRCAPVAPMRLSRRGSDLVIRELNPGGPVGPANKLDHQIWWAACFPGRPAGIRPRSGPWPGNSAIPVCCASSSRLCPVALDRLRPMPPAACGP